MAERKRSTKTKADVTVDAGTRILVLHGPEAMVKREHLETLKRSLTEAHGEIQPEIFNGTTALLADVLDELRTFSLMSTHKLVIVDAAEEFIKLYREPMERYAKSPVDHATLVLRAETWRPGNIDKAIKKVGAVIKCEMLKPAALSAWLVKRAKSEYGRELERTAASMLVERLGVTAMMQLDSELAKLAVTVEPDEKIGREIVEQLVGKGNDDQAWAVQEMVLNAIAKGGGVVGGGGKGSGLIEGIREMIDLGKQPDILLAYFVADLFRKLRLAQAMKAQGAPEGAIAKRMKLWGGRQQVFMSALRRLDMRRTGEMFGGLLDDDARSKRGLANATQNLECFAAVLTEH